MRVFLQHMLPFYSVYMRRLYLSSSLNHVVRSNLYLHKRIHTDLYVKSSYLDQIPLKIFTMHYDKLKEFFRPCLFKCAHVKVLLRLRVVCAQQKPEICGIICCNAKALAPRASFLPLLLQRIKEREGGGEKGRVR